MSRLWQSETVRIATGGLLFLAMVLLCEYVSTTDSSALRFAFATVFGVAGIATVWYVGLDRTD